MEHHYLHSSYRENLVEHLFVGELLRHLWCCGPHLLEVLDPQVDDGGYDVVLQYGSILRHVQLKASFHGAKAAGQAIHTRLRTKPSGCVIWVRFDAATLELGPFLWFGGEPGQPLPSLDGLKLAKQTRANSKGIKAERPNLRVIPRSKFVGLPGVDPVSWTPDH